MKTLFLLLSATCFAQMSPLVSLVTTVASASTIAPTSPIVFVSGTATITTITPPPFCTTTSAGCYVTLDATGAWQMNATVVPFTATANTAYTLNYAGGLWYGGPTGGGAPTLTASYLIVPYDSSDAGSSTGQAANIIWCYDAPQAAPIVLTTAWQFLNSGASSGVYGVAIYDANGNRLTAATSTGTSSTVSGTSSVALGGGTATFNPGTLGKLSICYTSNTGTSVFFAGPPANLSSYFSSSAPIFYLAANPSSTTGTTITWPLTLGAKTKIANGSSMATTLLVP